MEVSFYTISKIKNVYLSIGESHINQKFNKNIKIISLVEKLIGSSQGNEFWRLFFSPGRNHLHLHQTKIHNATCDFPILKSFFQSFYHHGLKIPTMKEEET